MTSDVAPDLPLVTHWIGGKSYDGTAERFGDVYDPATRQAHEAGRLRILGRCRRRRSAAASSAFSTWRHSSLSQRSKLLFAFRELATERARRAGRDRHLRARQGLRRRPGRGQPGARGHRVRLRHPAAPEGQLLRERLDQRGRVLDPPAARPGRRSSARSTSPPWCRPGSSRSPSPAATPSCSSRARRTPRRRSGWPSGGQRSGCRPGSSTSSTATRSPSTACLEHPDIKAVSFVGSTPIARYVYENGTRHGKRVQALGGAKNHMVVLPDADLDLAADSAVNAGFGSAGERCMAVSVLVAVEPVADELIAKICERMASLKVGRRPLGLRHGPARDTGAPRQGGLLPRRRRRRGRRAASSTAARRPRTARRTASGSGRRCSTRSRPEMSLYNDEIFGPVLSVVRVPTYDAALELVNSQPLRQRHRHLHQRRRGRPSLPERGRGRHGRGQRARSPCPSRTTPSGAGRARCSATATRTAQRASTSSPGARS